MKKFCLIGSAAALGLAVMLASNLALGSAGASNNKRHYKLEEKEQIKKTLTFEGGTAKREIEIDNVFGSIEVSGRDGDAVELVADKIIRAKAQENLAKAREEVTLDISREGGGILFYVDGPFRAGNEGESARRSKYYQPHRSNWRDPGYAVEFHFKLRIPRKTSVFLKTVTDGDIRVENIEGEFQVHNVNGRIDMERIIGSGDAVTVNGGVNIAFVRPPDKSCYFKTINGKLEIAVPENIKADFRLKTFNGEGFSDFAVTYLPSEPAEQSRRDGKFVWKKGGFQGIRIGGQGGPLIRMETLNGDIYINKSKV